MQDTQARNSNFKFQTAQLRTSFSFPMLISTKRGACGPRNLRYFSTKIAAFLGAPEMVSDSDWPDRHLSAARPSQLKGGDEGNMFQRKWQKETWLHLDHFPKKIQKKGLVGICLLRAFSTSLGPLGNPTLDAEGRPNFPPAKLIKFCLTQKCSHIHHTTIGLTTDWGADCH